MIVGLTKGISLKTLQKLFQIALSLILFASCGFAQLDLSKPLLSKWSHKIQSDGGFITIQNSRAIIPQNDGTLVALELPGGKFLWKTDIGGDIKSYVAVNNELALVSSGGVSSVSSASNQSNYLNAIRTDNGVTLWRTNLKFPFTLNNMLLKPILVSQENAARFSLYNVKKDTGETSHINSFIAAQDKKFQFFNDLIITKSKETQLDAFNLFTGKKIWTFQTHTQIHNFQTSSKNILYLSTDNGFLIAINTTNGLFLWQKQVANKIQTISQTALGVIANTPENNFFLYTDKGKRKWKKLIEGRTSNNYTVHKDFLIIFPAASNVGVILSMKNGKTLNRITLEPERYIVSPPVVTDKLLLLQTQKELLALSNQ